jgi:hypothetical protein
VRAIFIFFFSILSHWAVSQEIVRGKVVTDGTASDRINVVNTSTEKSTITDEAGYFSIPAAVGDALVFSAVNLETKRRVIESKDLGETIMVVKMSTSIIPLNEVKINDNAGITAENLGIIPKGQKKYTPAERRLNEATTGGGIVPLNPILNAISGRTAMLKKEVAVEKKERLLVKLDGWFEEKYYIQHLKLPREYIKGFHYFLIEDVDFVRALKAKNKTLTKFLMNKLVLDYKEIIATN